ncbi:endonuclease/exonuclease/phosphatase family protein [Uliginosibacterium sp. H3]|uniref:Endonuclease/exonuclease/phosphatase family protein n=1 Tax=Uliginosibacterium silvisoli TaxID=3114758 RepID=A0ABU6K8R1_9RHOO|nr:endonuclease/exonuclease/phosphatase family protein [Uliginosibacterium sp. H3]
MLSTLERPATPAHAGPQQAEQATLKVLTVNVHKGFTVFNRKFILPELRDAVRAEHVDIVFLQEVQGSHEHHAARFTNWPELPQYEFLADQIWKDFAYGKNAVYPHGHHGNAVLSKFPIVAYENRDVSMNTHEKRGLLHCEIKLPGHAEHLHAICAHLGLREDHRQKQLQLMGKIIDTQIPATAPIIVAGDFNDWRMRGHSVILQRLRLHEVFAGNHGKPARTFPARWPRLRLDRIYTRNLVSSKAQVLSSRPWSHLSDHAALSAEVSL